MYGAVENGSLVLFMRIAFLHSLNVARHGTRFIHASHWIVNRHAHH